MGLYLSHGGLGAGLSKACSIGKWLVSSDLLQSFASMDSDDFPHKSYLRGSSVVL